MDAFGVYGRGGGIRTRDLMHPMHAPWTNWATPRYSCRLTAAAVKCPKYIRVRYKRQDDSKMRELRNFNLSPDRTWLPDAMVVLYLPGQVFFTGWDFC